MKTKVTNDTILVSFCEFIVSLIYA